MKKNYVLLSGLILASAIGFSQNLLPDEVYEAQAKSVLSVQSDGDMDPDLIKKKTTTSKAYNDTLYYEDFDSTGTGGLPADWTVVNNSQNNFVWKWDDQYDQGPFSGNTDSIKSTTTANGFLSLPSDFYNIGTGGVSMDTYAETGNITNGANPMPNAVLVTFQQYYRFCCSGADEQTLQVSTDNFASFDEYDMTPGEVGNAANTSNAIGGEITVINISCTAAGADSIRMRIYANGHSNYFWMIDDFAVVEGPENDISIDDPYLEFNEANYTYYPFYGQIPYELFPPLPLFARLTNEGSVDQTNVRLVGNIDHLSFPGGATGVGNQYNIATLTPGGGTIVGPLCDSTVDVLTGTPRFVPTILGTFEASWDVSADSVDQVPSNNVASRTFTTTDTVFARDDNGIGGGIGPASFVDGATGTPGGTTVGDRFATLYILENRSGNGVDNIPTSVSFAVSTDTRNTGVEIVPKIWEYNEDSLFINGANFSIDRAFIREVASSFSTYTVAAGDLGNFISLPLTTGPAMTGGLDSGQYAVGWEVTNLPTGSTFEVQNDGSSAPFQVPVATFLYLAHAPAAGWGWVQGNPAIRLNMGNLPLSTGVKSTGVASAAFEVSPNPSNGEFKLTITSEAQANYNLNVRNMLGQLVYSTQVQVNGTKIERMNLSNLDKGVYFVTLENDSEKLLKKVVLK
ncbi:MAG: T9SS type A sorting domain-containing protein [Vicingaceae bacterium]